MRPRFQADADLNQKILAGLLRRQPDVSFLTAAQGAIVGLPDPAVLARATSSDRVLVSHDFGTMPRHFESLLLSSSSAGLILLPQSLDIGTAIENLLLIWELTEHSEWRNRKIYLPL